MKKSIKQMMRTPCKTGLFFLLVAHSAALFTVGLNLWLQTSESLRMANETFITIGTVTQKENTMASEAKWDAALKDYIYREYPVYNELFSADLLEIPSIEFINGIEQRPYFGAVSPDFIARSEDKAGYATTVVLAEIRPLRECLPNEPVEVEVISVLWGEQNLTGNTLFFCDHFSEQTQLMESDKTYIAYLTIVPYNFGKHENLTGNMEYAPLSVFQEQSFLWDEVTDKFYDTESGRRWKNLADELDKLSTKAVPVTPTEDIQLLQAFHQGEALIAQGRDISEEEYASGAKACLVSQSFAQLNGFDVGDLFELQIYFADYGYSSGQVSTSDGALDLAVVPLDSQDEPYEVFQSGNYTIVGIYSYAAKPSGSGYDLGVNEIIVPSKSITESIEQNIITEGPMQGYNTSFRIPNGTIDKAMEGVASLPESSFLEIQFYDNGYEQFADGLKNLMLIAVVLFFTGLASSIAVIVFFLYFSIVKHRRSTAIERALGMTKQQCVVSLLSGILLLTVLGSGAGSFFGTFLNSTVQEMVVSETDYFSTLYTRGIQHETSDETIFEMDDSLTMRTTLLTVFGETAMVCILSLILIDRNLKIAPIHYLGRREEE